MKKQGHGNETRFDGPADKIEEARKSGAAVGLFLAYKKFCVICNKDKPSLGARQIRQGLWKCKDCMDMK